MMDGNLLKFVLLALKILKNAQYNLLHHNCDIAF